LLQGGACHATARCAGVHNRLVIVVRGLPQLLFAASLGLAAACFESGDAVECPAGSSGCGCRDDGSCNADLVCNADGNCIDPNCVDGSLACPCYGNGSCDAGLVCTSNICQQGSGTTGVGGTTTGGPDASSSGGDASSTAGQTTDVADSGDTVAEVDSGPADSAGGCAVGCGPGEVCNIETNSCVATDYGPCAPGLDLCVPPAVCDDLGDGSFVCATPCVEAAPTCTAAEGAEVTCVEISGCRIVCSSDADCPPYEGMTCQVDRCAYVDG